MSVARAREVMARLRAVGITVHEWPGWESRGNGLTSAYEGIIIHHTATPFGFAPRVLVDGRPDLDGPLCNTAGNADGSVTMIAAHPANHAGAGSGPSLGPLPATRLFNPRVWGHEIVYPGTVPMTDAQYRTAQILARICVDVFGYGDIERARLHAETNGRGYEGKWDAGNGNGTTYDAAQFRRGAATILRTANVRKEDDDMLPRIIKSTSKGNNRVYALYVGPGVFCKEHLDERKWTVLKQLGANDPPIAFNEAEINWIKDVDPQRSQIGQQVMDYLIPDGAGGWAPAHKVLNATAGNSTPTPKEGTS